MVAIYPIHRQVAYTPPDTFGPGSVSDDYCYPTNPNMYPYNTSDARRYNSLDPYGGYPKTTLPIRDALAQQMPSAMTGFSSALDRRERVASHMPAPILPPIRIPDVGSEVSQSLSYEGPTRGTQVSDREASRASGGVAAHLDYEMDHMVDFVAETAQGMYALLRSPLWLGDIDICRSIQPNAAVQPAFRKYVSSILSSTRLPSSTIVLALHYLATRMTILSARSNATPDASPISFGSQLYPLLTTALMLASKFLDDNTFQNRSWADVSQIPVSELNRHELEWLTDIRWSLHITNPMDTQGFHAWYKRWIGYQHRRVAERRESGQRSVEAFARATDPYASRTLPSGYLPSPAYSGFGETPQVGAAGWPVVGRHSPNWNTWPNRVPRNPTPPNSAWVWQQQPQSQQSATARDQISPRWPEWPTSRKLTPPSAGHSGPATPDWYRAGSMGFDKSATQYGRPLPPPALSANHSPFDAQYGGAYHSATWGNGHGLGCTCAYCLHADRYGMGHGYGMQPVMA